MSSNSIYASLKAAWRHKIHLSSTFGSFCALQPASQIRRKDRVSTLKLTWEKKALNWTYSTVSPTERHIFHSLVNKINIFSTAHCHLFRMKMWQIRRKKNYAKWILLHSLTSPPLSNINSLIYSQWHLCGFFPLISFLMVFRCYGKLSYLISVANFSFYCSSHHITGPVLHPSNLPCYIVCWIALMVM